MAILEYFFLAVAVLGLVLRFSQYAPARRAEELNASVKAPESNKPARAKVARVRRPWIDSALLT